MDPLFFGKQKLRARLSLEVHGGPVLQIVHPQSETRRLRPRHSWSIDVALSSTGAELGLDMLLGFGTIICAHRVLTSTACVLHPSQYSRLTQHIRVYQEPCRGAATTRNPTAYRESTSSLSRRVSHVLLGELYLLVQEPVVLAHHVVIPSDGQGPMALQQTQFTVGFAHLAGFHSVLLLQSLQP
jgi:hypothetical protein